MSVGVLLITHDNIGSSLLETLQKTLGTLPLTVKVLPIRHQDDPEAFCYHAEKLCQGINEGHGVLILTDLFSATPDKIASKLIPNCRVRVVSGVNLPMLIRIMNYPKDNLDTLANKALSGGSQGILDVNSVLSQFSS